MSTPITDLKILVQSMRPQLQKGQYVFVTLENVDHISRKDTLAEFKEKEGITLVLEKSKADEYGLEYDFVAAWISLQVHSALEAVGLTAAFSNALTQHNISCNVIAAYHHDHIFVDIKDAAKAIEVLEDLSKQS